MQASTDPDFEDGKDEAKLRHRRGSDPAAFEYWDGSAWADTWDGRDKNSDGATLKGPPMAIRVSFWLNVPGPEPGETIEKEFRHTIAIRTLPARPRADPAAGLDCRRPRLRDYLRPPPRSERWKSDE